mgnify:CR=1 FL=1
MIYQRLLKNTKKLIEITETYDLKKFEKKDLYIIISINIGPFNF